LSQTHEITRRLREWRSGNRDALEELIPVVYDELHKQAARYLRRERPGHTLQTTALIHETFLRLTDGPNVDWQDRMHFFAISANLMRQILVDHARARSRKKRGGGVETLPLNEELVIDPGANVSERSVDLIALDEALDRLAEIDERQVRVVELRFFSGLTLEESAKALKISRSTAANDWNLAKAWLHRELTR
jgi:RNA polymerase sigma-70 factor (ECF subfamily)